MENFGFATVTFTNQITTHDVTMPFTFEVNVDELDAGELAWEAAAEWDEAGWGSDNPLWSVNKVTVTTSDGTVHEIELG